MVGCTSHSSPRVPLDLQLTVVLYQWGRAKYGQASARWRLLLQLPPPPPQHPHHSQQALGSSLLLQLLPASAGDTQKTPPHPSSALVGGAPVTPFPGTRKLRHGELSSTCPRSCSQSDLLLTLPLPLSEMLSTGLFYGWLLLTLGASAGMSAPLKGLLDHPSKAGAPTSSRLLPNCLLSSCDKLCSFLGLPVFKARTGPFWLVVVSQSLSQLRAHTAGITNQQANILSPPWKERQVRTGLSCLTGVAHSAGHGPQTERSQGRFPVRACAGLQAWSTVGGQGTYQRQ